jgi:hypothetical protein
MERTPVVLESPGHLDAISAMNEGKDVEVLSLCAVGESRLVKQLQVNKW